MNKETANKHPISSDIGLISLYKEYRDYLKHEETLINNRTTWLITGNALLIAALGVIFQKRLDQLANANTDVRVSSSTLGVLLSPPIGFGLRWLTAGGWAWWR